MLLIAGDQLPAIPLFDVVGKALIVAPEQNGPIGSKVGVVCAPIVTVVVTFVVGQAPEAGIAYVTVYVPGVLKLGFISPDEFIDNPEVDEYVPPV